MTDKKKNLRDWKLYINDSGIIYCNESDCIDDVFDWSCIGRRTSAGEFLDKLAEHARDVHGTELVSEAW